MLIITKVIKTYKQSDLTKKSLTDLWWVIFGFNALEQY